MTFAERLAAHAAAGRVLSPEQLAAMTKLAAQKILLDAAQVLTRETHAHDLAIALCVVAAWLEQGGNVQPDQGEKKELVNDEHQA